MSDETKSNHPTEETAETVGETTDTAGEADSTTGQADSTVEVTPERSSTEVDTDASEIESGTDAAIVDLAGAAEYETAAAAMREIVERQQEQIDELNDLLLDLSARVADNDGAGVCPDCHGPVVKMGGLLKRTKIECADCGRVFHRY